MKLRCAYCHEPFKPSSSQAATLQFPTHTHFCSQACKCQSQVRVPQEPAQPPAPVEDRFAGAQDLHIRVPGKRELQKLVRALADVDCELVRIRPVMDGRTWSLQRERPPGAPGSIGQQIGAIVRERAKAPSED